MNKYLVIGNPIAHSLSPLLHNYWFKKYRFLDSIYEKKKVEKKDLKKIVEQIKNDEVKGVNVTVPFKREIFNFIDTAPYEVQFTKSVNTLVKENDKVIGYNTDQQGFEISLEENDWDCKDKKILIIGAGGVTPSILSTLIKVDGAVGSIIPSPIHSLKIKPVSGFAFIVADEPWEKDPLPEALPPSPADILRS